MIGVLRRFPMLRDVLTYKILFRRSVLRCRFIANSLIWSGIIRCLMVLGKIMVMASM